jgi:hypothetical protein
MAATFILPKKKALNDCKQEIGIFPLRFSGFQVVGWGLGRDMARAPLIFRSESNALDEVVAFCTFHLASSTRSPPKQNSTEVTELSQAEAEKSNRQMEIACESSMASTSISPKHHGK